MSDEGLRGHTSIRWQGNVGVAEFDGGARSQHAIFYNKSVHNPVRSQAEGHPVYEDKIYVRVAPPGERWNIVDRPATGQDSRIWPVQWAAFQQNKEQTPEGMPIELLYPEKPAVAATLRANGVFTVEQCAELSGNAIDSIGMGAQKWVNDAKKTLAFANKAVGATQFRNELEDRDRKITVLERQVEQLVQEVTKLRSTSSTATQLADIQALIAGAMGRPQHPSENNQVGKKFDVATQQINAVNSQRNKRVRVRP